MTDIARIDTVFRERLGTGRMLTQKLVSNVMEVSHQRHVNIHLIELISDMRDSDGRLGTVHGDAHEFRTRTCQFRRLRHRGFDISGIGIGHGLYDDGRTTTEDYMTNLHRNA